MPWRAKLYAPRPLKSISSFLVMMVPSVAQRGQKVCFIFPHGFFGSVPYVLVPFLPTWNPGAVRVILRLTTVFSLTADFRVYEEASSLSSNATPSA